MIFFNIFSILINYFERLSKLLFEYFMVLYVNILRIKCFILVFNNVLFVRIYFRNLCSLLSSKGGIDLEFYELLGDIRVKCDLFYNKRNIY